jgi:hypothetical protein
VAGFPEDLNCDRAETQKSAGLYLLMTAGLPGVSGRSRFRLAGKGPHLGLPAVIS